MPLLIIAGVPLELHRRNKKLRFDYGRWSTRLFPSKDNRPHLDTCWKDVLRAADNSSPEGAHIFAYHSYEEEYRKFYADIHSRHRLTWMNRSSLAIGIYGTHVFEEMIKELLDFEDRWRLQVRPLGHQWALYLPESSFSTNSAFSSLWERAQRIQREHDKLDAVVGLANRFRSFHHTDGVWIDGRELRFDPRGARHGRIPIERRWKYTSFLDDGFHYDVQKVEGGSFTIKDSSGKRFSFARYTNIDCHGHIRGGE